MMQFSWQTKARKIESTTTSPLLAEGSAVLSATVVLKYIYMSWNARSSTFRQVLYKTTVNVQNGGKESHRTPLVKNKGEKRKKKKRKCKFLKSSWNATVQCCNLTCYLTLYNIRILSKSFKAQYVHIQTGWYTSPCLYTADVQERLSCKVKFLRWAGFIKAGQLHKQKVVPHKRVSLLLQGRWWVWLLPILKSEVHFIILFEIQVKSWLQFPLGDCVCHLVCYVVS